MINITITPNSLTIEGHAQYDKYGRDIVCASVSVLGQMLLNETMDKDILSGWKIRSGYLHMEFKSLDEKTKYLKKVVENALWDITMRYSEYVQIKEEGYD